MIVLPQFYHYCLLQECVYMYVHICVYIWVCMSAAVRSQHQMSSTIAFPVLSFLNHVLSLNL